MLGCFRGSAESKVLRLKDQRVPKSVLTAGGEERSAGNVFETVKDEETVLCVALGFERAAAPNVDRREASFQQRRADHQETMALQGVFFGTHEGGDAGAGDRESALEACDKIRSAAARGVVDEAVFAVDARIGGPAAQSFAKKFVANSRLGKDAFEWLAIELRKSKARRTAADVAKNPDALSSQDGEKIGNFEIGMTDGEERIGRAGVDIHRRDSRGKAYFAGRLERQQARQQAGRVCILPAKPGGGGGMKSSP
jgi:hypothetical protein